MDDGQWSPIRNDRDLDGHTNERRVFREYGFLLPNQSKKSNRNPSVVRRTSAGLDDPMGFTMSLEQYESIQNKRTRRGSD